MSVQSNAVFCSKAPARGYDRYPGLHFPELPSCAVVTTSLIALRSLFKQAGLDRVNQGSPNWNPLGTIVRAGDKVLIKPNWVHHRNGSGHGLDCLVTHTSVIEAILLYVAKANPQSIIVCDAPIQGCDFEALIADRAVPEMMQRITANKVEAVIMDLRRTIRGGETLSGVTQEYCRPMKNYILFDLRSDSLLEAITHEDTEFRVTMYHPDLLKRTHSLGRHQYLVARDVIEADVVINVPKLKTHKKACLTGALKNMVGINGHKEYLPHHQKGGSSNSGDCYPGHSLVKRLVEETLDAANRARGRVVRPVLAATVKAAMALGKMMGADNNYDGSWYGNDTVWRMCLDLQRVLHYGLRDGTMSNQVQRRVLTITDAIIAGEGDGPLSPTPVELGMMTFGVNPAALDWVHAILMGLAPARIPLTREAFISYRYPLTDFPPENIVVHVDGLPVHLGELFARYGHKFRLPTGWEPAFESRWVQGSEAVEEPA
jgi:uncharacterized protein (DUF362 family)